MKILHVIPRFNPTLGGGVDVVYNVAKGLQKRGHQVTIITTKYLFDNNYADSIRSYGVEVIPFDYIFNYALFIPSPKMDSWLQKNIHTFDIIHLNGTRSYQNNLISKYARKKNIPYILQSHGSFERIIERKILKKLYDSIWGDNIILFCSGFIALSEFEASIFKGYGINHNKIAIIPNGVDLSLFEKLPEKNYFRKKFSIPENIKLVLYLGRLHKSKGLDLLIDSHKKLIQKNPNCELLLVGPDGGYKKILERKIAKYKLNDKIKFTGLISDNDKYGAFVDSDVFVTPRFFGFPITFAEACTCQLPIVTTNDGDYLDWINNVGTITDFNSDAFSNAIEKILADKRLKDRLGFQGKNLIVNSFNWKIISEDLEKVYKKLYRTIDGFRL